MKQNSSVHSSVRRHLVVTALAGVVFWFLGELIYAATMPNWANPIALALYFAVFGVIMAIVLFFLTANKADMNDKRNKDDLKQQYRSGAAVFCIFLVLTAGFEFLYELGKQSVPDPTSYIFLIDDSGSMSGTEQLRTDGITSIMEHNSSNLPYAVYMFTDHADSIKEMDSYRAGDADKIQFQSDGNTDILGSLSTVLSDLQTGKIKGAGSAPRVLLLSDGNSGNYGLKELCEQAAAQGVSVSTVGMGSSNDRMLKKIAALTGGVFVRCDDASTLGEKMETAITSSAERNLLSERFVFKNDTLYGILRVVFLVLMGIVWSLFKAQFAWGEEDGGKKVRQYSIAACTIAAVLMELLANTGFSLSLLRLIFCVLWAITYGHAVWIREKIRPVTVSDTSPGGTTGTTETTTTTTTSTLQETGNTDGEIHTLVTGETTDTNPQQTSSDLYGSSSESSDVYGDSSDSPYSD